MKHQTPSAGPPAQDADATPVLRGPANDVTEREQADHATREMAYLLSESQRVAHVGGWVWDLAGPIRWTAEAYRIYGVSPETFVPTVESLTALVHPEDRLAMQRWIEACATGQSPDELEFRAVRSDGTVRLLAGRGELVAETAGRRSHIIGTVRDITERKRADEVLRQERALYLDLVNAQPAGIYRLRVCPRERWHEDAWHSSAHPPYSVELASDRFCQVLGVSRQVFEANPYIVDDLVHHDDKAEFARLNTEANAKLIPFRWEGRLVVKGSVIWVYFESLPRPLEDGDILWTGIIDDVTERKQAEAILRKSEERHRLALNATSDGIWDIDFEDGTVHFNEPYAAAFGKPSENEESWAWWTDHVHPDDRERVLSSFNAAVNGSADAWKCDYRFRRIDGTWANTNDRAHISRDGAGKAQYIIGALSDITESKQAEATLRASAEEFRSLAEAMPQIVWVTRKDGWNTYFNQQWVDYTGLTQEQSRGHGWNIPFHPDDQQRASDAWQNATNAGGTYSLECRLRRADGVYRWWLVRGVPLRDHTGDILKWFGTCTDIHDMKQAEAATVSSELRYRRLFESARDGILILDADTGAIVDVNPFLIELLGYSRETFLGKTLWDLGFFKDIIANQDSFEELQREEYVRYDDKPLETSDGRRIDVEFVSNVYLVDGHKVIQCNIRDVTERKQAKDVLAESVHRYRTLVENAPLAVFVNRLDRVVLANVACLELFGATAPEQLLGKSPLELFHPDFHPAIRERIHELRDVGKVVPLIEEKIIRLDGTSVDVEVTAAPFLDQGVNAIHVVLRDITDRKRAEAEKATLEAQLQQAQKMESVGRLAGGVAHDFNNMLGVILGHAELALQVSGGQPIHDDITAIRGAALRSANLTRQLLAFARKQTVAPRVLDLNATVAGMLNMLNRLIGENIHLQWKPGADLWSVKVDPSQIDQILANLCVNARDAISGVGTLTIETDNSTLDNHYCAAHAGCAPGEYVRLVVSDDGCGMDKDTQSHLFEPFFTTKPTGEGTGLGLATVYGAVKQNSGHINVYSEPGRGTAFTIYLPRHADKAVQTQAAGTTRLVPSGHETILLVEDEPSILALTKTLLERQGYTVLAASTPGEAIRLAKQHSGEIHLLMTDVVMPEMNGRMLAKNLLALYPHLKRLFMSGYTADVIAHHGVLDEGVQFIQKPFTLENLAAKVREALVARD